MEVRDSTANSMVVLERGAGGVSTLIRPSSRPPSGRQSRNVTPIQRSGSQLEVLPPEDENKKSYHSSGPPGHNGSADRYSRQTLSAGSSGRKSRQGEESAANVKRASSVDDMLSSPREDACSRPGSRAHKEVSLMTVKRNYETHGIPKNESWDFIPKDVLTANPTPTNGNSPVHKHECHIPGEKKGLHDSAERTMTEGMIRGNGDGENTVSSEERTEQRLKYLMEQLSVKNKEIKQHDERRKSGHASQRRESSDTRRFASTVMSDSYYVSTGTPAELRKDAAGPSKKPSHAIPPFLEDRNLTEKVKKSEEEVEDGINDDEDDDTEEEEEGEEGPFAPIELMGEFLDAVMDEEYETADKLCKMILMYEPDNKECLQFKPLIEEMLRREWDRQLWGSDSDEDTEEESEGEDDDGDDEDEDEETDSDEEESDSDSSESEEEKEEVAQEK